MIALKIGDPYKLHGHIYTVEKIDAEGIDLRRPNGKFYRLMTAQNNTATAEGIAPRTIIGGLPLVENARLIEVTTINKKIVAQLPKRQIRFDEVELNMEVLGKIEALSVIVIRDNDKHGQLATIHQTDFNDWRTRTADSKTAWLEYRAMPQLFEA